MYLIKKILCYWYQHQLMPMGWGCFTSNVCKVTNGVRQGAFYHQNCSISTIYIDGLSNMLNNSLICGSLGGN